MCLAVPGKLIRKNGSKGVVDFGGLRRKADLSLLENVKIGDYVLVHVGFAIQKVDEKIARESNRLLFGADI
ncbi:HypC/HybG/HupF family hydrogenase formation chaperone [Candidatus Woesearchaeota archaeon]|nr:MAG: HypC/HybG/HupF family hydrogenase formation chaperone [Candidatus Woesearchaeota archaeon]